MAKPCKNCGMTGHSQAFCWAKAKHRARNRKAVKKIGKVAQQWLKTRAEWFRLNPPNEQGYYICYICGDWLLPKETTLDHVLPRSSHPHLRFDLNNLKPCCWRCNTEKGSKKLAASGQEAAETLKGYTIVL